MRRFWGAYQLAPGRLRSWASNDGCDLYLAETDGNDDDDEMSSSFIRSSSSSCWRTSGNILP